MPDMPACTDRSIAGLLEHARLYRLNRASLCQPDHHLETPNSCMKTAYTLITGANSGIGYALATQMLQHAVSTNQPKVVILACRSMARAEKARHGILQQVYPASALAEDQKGVYAVSPSESVQIVHLDLASPKSVFQACTEIRSRFPRLDNIVLNAGVIPLVGIAFSAKNFTDFLTRPSWVLTTGGNFLKQSVGETTDDRLGYAFAANVFGHYIMVRELEAWLQPNTRILWMSSSSASAEAFDLQDIQGLQNPHSYEASKFLTNVISCALAERLSPRNIHVFNCNPGAVATNITNGFAPVWFMALFLCMIRIFMVRELNVYPEKATTALLHVLHHTDPARLDKQKQYVSDCTLWGETFVATKDLDRMSPDLVKSILGQLDSLYQGFCLN